MNFAILPVTKWFTWNETAPTATALFLSVTDVRAGHIVRAGPSRLCVWLTNLQPGVQKLSLESFGQPRARAKATNEERVLSGGLGIEFKKLQAYEQNW